jgi:hypothetical protein
MAELLETLTRQLGRQGLEQISKSLGADTSSTRNAVSAVLPTLLGALARNASRPEGARDLSNALSRDHDGSILDNLGDFLGQAQSGPGDGILGHVLGSRRPRVENALSRSTGLDAGSVGKLLVMLAPIVMGALGKKQRERSIDPRGLSELLERERGEVERSAPQEMGLLGKLLDTDGDGDVDISDIAKTGFSALNRFLGNR